MIKTLVPFWDKVVWSNTGPVWDVGEGPLVDVHTKSENLSFVNPHSPPSKLHRPVSDKDIR